jgi:hypothetical protein
MFTFALGAGTSQPTLPHGFDAAWSVRSLIQQPLDSLGLASNDLQISLGWPIRLRAALLPVPESAEWDVVADGEFLLRQCQGAANDFCLRRSLHPV